MEQYEVGCVMVSRSGTMSRVVKEIKEDMKAEAVAIVSREGLMLAGELMPNVHDETFAIIAATILGASLTAYSELGKMMPEIIILKGGDAITLLGATGADSLLVVTVGENSPDLEAKFDNAIKKVIAYK